MNQASRTQSGIRNEDLFYPHEFLVFVEDEEDACFWGQIVPVEHENRKARFKPVGGKKELLNRISEFDKDGGMSIVAMDSDYDYLLGTAAVHNRIISTHGYSIENAIVCTCRVSTLLSGMCLLPSPPVNEVELWLSDYNESTRALFITDLALRKRAHTFPKDPLVAARFWDNSKSLTLSRQRIGEYIASAGIAEPEMTEATTIVGIRSAKEHFRGHFLMEAVGAFVRRRASAVRKRSVTLSHEGLFAGLVDCGKACDRCSEAFRRLREQAAVAVRSMAQRAVA